MRLAPGPVALFVDEPGGSKNGHQLIVIAVHIAHGHNAINARPDPGALVLGGAVPAITTGRTATQYQNGNTCQRETSHGLSSGSVRKSISSGFWWMCHCKPNGSPAYRGNYRTGPTLF